MYCHADVGIFVTYIHCGIGWHLGGGGGSGFGSGYGGSYGGGAMKSTGYGQRGAGPYGGLF